MSDFFSVFRTLRAEESMREERGEQEGREKDGGYTCTPSSRKSKSNNDKTASEKTQLEGDCGNF
jgi:hypothetical protein